MGMLNFLRNFLSEGKTSQEPQSAAKVPPLVDNVGKAYAPDEISGLDFKKAIDAHMLWKDRLRNAIEGGGSEQLDLIMVACDDRCVLGKWIHGPGGEAHGQNSQFQALKQHHAEFHIYAAGVLTEAQNGRTQEALRQLTGQYARASEQVKHDLIRLYLDIRKTP